MGQGRVLDAAFLHHLTNDQAGAFTGAVVTLTSATIVSVNKFAPQANQVVTLPSAALMISGGWPPGSRFLFVKDTSNFFTTIVPDVADTIIGGIALLLAPGLPDVLELQLSASVVFPKWILPNRDMRGKSISAAVTAPLVLTAGTMRETTQIIASGAGAITLPTIASLFAIGWPPGTDFVFVKDQNSVVTVAPNGANTFLGGAVISLAASAGHAATVRLPALSADTVWFVVQQM